MTRRIFAASHQRGVELAAAGCPLDSLDALADRSAPARKLFRAKQLTGYAESRVYLFGPLHTGYVIGLRLSTDRPSGTVITEWNVKPPWPGHAICWDYEAPDLIPKRNLGDYTDLLDSRLMGVLNERLSRGAAIRSTACCAVIRTSRSRNPPTKKSRRSSLWSTISETTLSSALT